MNVFDNEIFFERNANSFSAILSLYRTGKMHEYEKVCAHAFNDDLTYWGLNEFALDECCQSSEEDQNYTDENIEQENVDDCHVNIEKESAPFEENNMSTLSIMQKKLWLIMEYPSCSSWPTKVRS